MTSTTRTRPSSLPAGIASPHARWDRALTYVLVVAGLALAGCLLACGPRPQTVLYAWPLATYSFELLLLAGLVTALPHRPGNVLAGLAYSGLFCGGVWYIASVLLYEAQGRNLLFAEVVKRVAEPGSRQFVFDLLLSKMMVAYAAAFIGGAVTLWLLVCRRRRPQVACAATLLSMAALATPGMVLSQLPPGTFEADRYRLAVVAPWSSAAPLDQQYDAEYIFDLQQGRLMRDEPSAPFWVEGADPILAPLVGAYTGRSAIVIVLESHRASDIDVVGEGSFGHQPCSPRLAALAGEGMVFDRCFAGAYATIAAQWSLFTGLPSATMWPMRGPEEAPDAGRLGVMPALTAAGYSCQWLSPADPELDNWNLVLGAAGAHWKIEQAELDSLDEGQWNSYGLPDEQVYVLARRRYERAMAAQQPLLLGIFSISNHPPFTFPDEIDGRRLPRDFVGGMLYADACLGDFMDWLRSLPEEQQPLVFITADSAHRHGLRDGEPLGREGLEAMRIPGVLWAPGAALAGLHSTAPLCHEDVLDLLQAMVAPAAPSGRQRFRDLHREVAPFCGTYPFSLVTADRLYHGPSRRLFDIVDGWQLTATGEQDDRILAARDRLQADMRVLWRRSR